MVDIQVTTLENLQDHVGSGYLGKAHAEAKRAQKPRGTSRNQVIDKLSQPCVL
jgi:hypothetical protein